MSSIRPWTCCMIKRSAIIPSFLRVEYLFARASLLCTIFLFSVSRILREALLRALLQLSSHQHSNEVTTCIAIQNGRGRTQGRQAEMRSIGMYAVPKAQVQGELG
ncbi:hypothetical protein K504DRAFT_266315 [Pleomassaria siparia CBS 279.74]|uniref:Uncharacterized protein n=1 Tax=Pleomassaria siparia CBS 279.74 TaxID=1314801 RepID=A0A6G1KD90_9PLEO|nr:hypothetical protein K504DRAFT_266315 [Pleomassaria siparia CBS 279.74]